MVPPEVQQQFIPARSGPAGATLVYEPRVLGAAKVRFTDPKSGLDTTSDLVYLAPISDGAVPIDWDNAEATSIPLTDLEKSPAASAQFGALPPAAAQAKSYNAWRSDFAGWLFRNATLDLRQAGREQRDALVARIRAQYAPKVQRLEERIRNAQQVVEREQGQARSAQLQTAISVGATVLGSLLGRKRISATSLGRATTAARGVGRTIDQQQDVGRARADVGAAQAELASLNQELEQKLGALDSIAIRPTKSNIAVEILALAWVPFWRDQQGTKTPGWS
jgi:outer membrane murein-binding lipoprotein Lpp